MGNTGKGSRARIQLPRAHGHAKWVFISMLTQCCETNGHIGDLQLGIYTNNLKNNDWKHSIHHGVWS